MAIDEKPSRNEDEYFAKVNADLIKAQRAKLDAERLERERAAHKRKCPNCGADLREQDHHGLKIDVCPECRGVWLDQGELELLEKYNEGGVSSFVNRLIRGTRV